MPSPSRPALAPAVALLALLTAADARAQDGEGPETLFLSAHKVIVRPGEVLEDAHVLVEDGWIIAVGPDLEAPDGAREIEGEVVCSGFLDPWSTLGLAESDAGDGGASAATRTVDGLDVYSNPQARREALRAGVVATRTQAGELAQIGGIGAVVRLAPDLPREEAVLLEDANVGAAVGVSARGESDPFDRISEVEHLADELEKGEEYAQSWLEYRDELAEWEKAIAEKEAELEKDFKKAKKDREKDLEEAEEKGKEFKEKKYKEDRKPRIPRPDPDKAVLGRVANGELPLVVQANRAAELRELLRRTERFDRLRLVIAGGAEALTVADELARREIPVILWPAPFGPERADELDGHDPSLAGRLEKAGVEVLLGSGGHADATRDLPLLAAAAVGHGLSYEAALRALTVGAARTFDLADRFGSVRRGRPADLLVLDGEPLRSNTRVRYVISGGRVAVSPED